MRNQLLDAVKAVSAYFVVLLHIRFPGRTGEVINVLARFAVPFFFMVSGYFCYNVHGKSLSRLPGKIKHVLFLTVLSYPFYILWQCVQRSIEGKDLSAWLGKLTEGEHIKEFFLYNNSSPVKWHLWFLPALLYCYLLFAVAEKLRIHKIAYVLIPVLLAGHFWMEEACAFTGNSYETMEFRNYLYTGFPFFMTGHLIHRYEGVLREKLSGVYLTAGILCGALLSVAEYFRFGILELFVGSVILSVSVFLGAVLQGSREAGRLTEFFGEIGGKYAFFIYLFHLAVADVVKDLAVFFGVNGSAAYGWLRPVLVCVLTTFLAMGISALRPVHLRKNVV
ncbi:MAG: acyltransferase [Eubacteriales bacterium]|nr:acyltransferase [Eubacteriales bacterium]